MKSEGYIVCGFMAEAMLYCFRVRDKRDPLHTTDAIYEIPCMNCIMSYVGETGRKFNTRLEEHKSEVEKVSGSVTTTRAGRKESLTTIHKSAITDHVVEKKHVIGWGKQRS